MTSIDYALGTPVSDGYRTGSLVFSQDVDHPGFPSLPTDERVGFIAFDVVDADGHRHLYRLSADMTFAASEAIILSFPGGFKQVTPGEPLPLSRVADHVARARAPRT